MVTLVKGNTEVRVADEEVTAYLVKGYAVVDAKGKVMRIGKMYSYDELLAINRQNERTIHRQEMRIAELESKLNGKTAAEPPKTSTESGNKTAEANGAKAKKAPATAQET